MQPERHERVESIFLEAATLDAGARAEYLGVVCADDPTLRREVETLLEAHDRTSGLLESPPLGVGRDEPALAGSTVGRYRLVREVGRGGMATVFLAERADREFEHRVALKLVTRAAVRPELLERSRAERQILAALQHSNIARLLDGGTTEDGRPYLVMEHVDGLPLIEYCDRERLDVAARLRLFVSICDAVHYAHRNLVLHRDLKSSNILVTRQGEVKLLDFGIAKLLDAGDADISPAQTRTGMLLLTPDCASPEQIRGEPLTTSSDVYALGVLLYELLCGHRPYSLRGLPLPEMARTIAEVEPPPPSSRLLQPTRDDEGRGDEHSSRARSSQPAALRRQLRGDLDAITLGCLRKEPGRRYASAQELAEDIRRHLSGQPVRARPDSLRYRLGKLVHRHRLAATAAAIALVALLLGLAGTSWQARVAAVERDRARREAEKSGRVVRFMQELFQGASPLGEGAGGRDTTAADLLERGAQRLGELGSEPEAQASLTGEIGWSYHGLGDYRRADALLAEAVELLRALPVPDDVEIARHLNRRSYVQEALGNYEDALELEQEAHALLLRELGPGDPATANLQCEVAAKLVTLGRDEEAMPGFREALVVFRATEEDGFDALTCLHNYGWALRRQGKDADAVPVYRRVLALTRARFGETGEVLQTMGALAVALRRTGSLDEAEALQSEAVEKGRRVFGPRSPNFALLLNNLARVKQSRGDHEAAVPLFRETIDILSELLGEDHHNVAIGWSNLATALLELGEDAEAEALYRRALAVLTQALPEGDDRIALPHVGLGRVLQGRGLHAAAEPYLRRALALREANRAAGHPAIAEVQALLGRSLARLDRADEAEALLLAAHQPLREAGETRNLAPLLEDLADLFAASGRAAEAERYREALAALESRPAL